MTSSFASWLAVLGVTRLRAETGESRVMLSGGGSADFVRAVRPFGEPEREGRASLEATFPDSLTGIAPLANAANHESTHSDLFVVVILS